MKTSQKKQIRNYLESGGHLTQMAALNFWGCFRLASRIHDINNDLFHKWVSEPRGVKLRQIESVKVKTSTGKFVAEYSLDKLN